MRYLLAIPPLLFATPAYADLPAEAVPISLGCNTLAVGTTDANVAGYSDCAQADYSSSFPYSVPADKVLCVTWVFMSNKYAMEPISAGNAMHTMYFEIGIFTPGLKTQAISVPAHHVEIHPVPPIPIEPSTSISAGFLNGEVENQRVLGWVNGYLMPATEDCLGNR